ncbi:uncharacterized protein FA14DRAFT_153812 [Meira miltonrushii]|uniref:Uncharacterized protein n=1 Tax=Meira miltonrushii TaxID=1280837 RepID=A0A316VQQ4_9BASI|nr:uncharacterized protein FA14DRAFT_153812 [Meira miltonrushii]PWN38491.1 hypothetical protein FA14DRAFT_153812 [Meira miltonrushii]
MPTGFYTIEEKAKRMANNQHFLRTNQLNTFEEAFEAAKQKLRKQKTDANKRFMVVQSSSGVTRRKQKDYHRKNHNTKESVITRKMIAFLKEKNEIYKHDKARKKLKNGIKSEVRK